MITKLGYTKSELMSRYNLVIHLVTAADGAEEFYTLSNNEARSESPEEARLLDRKTQHAWLGHPHHMIVDNSTDFATKMVRALRALTRTLNMPDPTEIERKFRVLNFTPDLIPSGAVALDIVQDYLKCEKPGERRLRKRVHDGEARFFHTEKLPTEERGTRIEREHEVTETEYQLLMQQRDPTLHTVEKTRYAFPFGGKLIELDVLKGRHAGLVLLEVELQHIDDPVTLPSGWNVTEVTDDPQYKNRTLAE
jgi:CYTH domain-containing protein